MMRMRGGFRFVLKLRVASRAHLVGIVAKFERRAVGRFIVRVRIVAGATAHSPFLEAFRALERFHDKSGLSEAAVLVKAFARKFAERNHRVAQGESARGGVVQFAMRSRRADRGLPV